MLQQQERLEELGTTNVRHDIIGVQDTMYVVGNKFTIMRIYLDAFMTDFQN